MGVSLEVGLLALFALTVGALGLQTLRLRRSRRGLDEQASQIGRAGCIDDLTGLTTRGVFQEIVRREIAHARRSGGCIGLAILDVDDLKLVNDGLGLDAGDEVLITLGSRLAQATRDSDTLARLGGDQFALLLAKCDRTSDVMTAVYRLSSIWKEPLIVRGRELRVSCCVGLSVFPDDAESAAEALGHAGSALAKAKERGFDSLCVFDDHSDRLAVSRLEWREDLKRALDKGEFELHLQPQISLPDGRLVGAEGLVRWRHPREGLLTAQRFIPLAEQMGLMPDLSAWVLREICRRNAEWQEAELPVIPISVNVSVRHFQTRDVSRIVAECLNEAGLDGRLLHLEVTETAALHDVELMTDQFARLRKLGVGLQLDDFGTGYSSLSYLLRYPLNVIKIDRAFVTGLHENAHGEAIVRATLAMAKALGLDVVAEGVETVEELGRLIELGCPTVQGFLLAKPMPCDEFERLLIAGRVPLPETRAA